MLNYVKVKNEVKAQLANVSSFTVVFKTTSTCNAFKFVTPGSKRKFTRKDTAFTMGNGKDRITAASIAHVVAHNEGQLILEE